jgi:MFS family permease
VLPALVSAGWFDTGAAAYLGAANLAGYLCGATGPRYLGARWLLRGAIVLATVSLFACAWPMGFAWFFAWRLLSGLGGGLAMVLAAPTILPHIPLSRHGLVGGAIFVGVGAGIAISGTLIPLLLQEGHDSGSVAKFGVGCKPPARWLRSAHITQQSRTARR